MYVCACLFAPLFIMRSAKTQPFIIRLFDRLRERARLITFRGTSIFRRFFSLFSPYPFFLRVRVYNSSPYVLRLRRSGRLEIYKYIFARSSVRSACLSSKAHLAQFYCSVSLFLSLFLCCSLYAYILSARYQVYAEKHVRAFVRLNDIS